MFRILVVDEDASSRRQTAEVLSHFDCTVRTVGEPDVALRIIQHARLDAVLVSASLPQMPATAFVDAVHQQTKPLHVPVIVTAVTPRGSVDAIRAGARGCIRKPIDEGGVVAVLPPLLRDGAHQRRRGSALDRC